MIWSVLKGKISFFHLLAFLLANGLGLAVVLLSIQAYQDFRGILTNKTVFADQGLITISKKVSLFRTLRQETTHFPPDEIEAIRRHPAIEAVGEYLPAAFQVEALAYTPGSRRPILRSDFFFEAVPDEFLDVTPDNWTWQIGDSLVPIIIPRSYLSLYNFGFAVSQNLPQLSDNTVSQIMFDLHVYGNGHQDTYRGRITGFSQQLNSILVPHTFLAFANERYGSGRGVSSIMRLLAKPSDPSDPRLAAFLSQQNYEFDQGKLQNQRLHFFLKLITAGMMFIGILICSLALGLFLMSFFLLFERNKSDIQLLYWLGYSPAHLYRPFWLALGSIGNLAFGLGGIGMVSVRGHWLDLIENQLPTFEAEPSTATILVGVLGLNAVLFLSVVVMRRRMFRLLL